MPARSKSPAIAALVDKVRPYLADYLVSQEVESNDQGKFLCLNPEHDDHTPSMHINPYSEGTKTKCFVCDAAYDIFKVASILEGKPDKGPGWVYSNVYYLAKKFDVPFEEVQPTEEELLYMQQASMYDDAAAILESLAEKKEYVEYCLSRGLTTETCRKFGVATVPWDEFSARMRAQGHDIALCERYGLDRDMFNTERVTFILRDVNGFVIGFARKYLPYDKEGHRAAKAAGRPYPAKYSNTSSRVLFFDKSSFLYGLYHAKSDPHKRLDLYEGYFDWLYAQQAGIRNCAAVCGTSLTESQVELIQSVGFNTVNLIYDSEEEGVKAARKSLETFAGREGLYITVTFLPFEDHVPPKDRDPDEFLKLYGLEAYNQVRPLSAFEWRLHDLLQNARPKKEVVEELDGDWEQYKDLPDNTQICETMIPFLLNEPSKIRQAQLITVLSKATDVSEEDIRAELARRTDKQVALLAQETAFRLTKARDSKQAAEVIRKAACDLNAVSNPDLAPVDLSWDESCRAFLEACSQYETEVDGIGGWVTGWKAFDEDFDGLAKEGQILGIAGAPNCGKSAWLTSLANNLLLNNKEGLSVIFHVLDDPRPVAFAKLMSCLTEFPINYIVHANRYLLHKPDLATAYTKAKEWLAGAMKDGRLIIKGQEMGNDTDLTTQLIDGVVSKTGNKVVYIGDSFHSLDDGMGHDERIRFKRVAEWAMRIAETRRMTMVFTVELTKMGMEGRPRLQHLAETGKLAYAMKAVGMVYNELHDRRRQATTFWMDETYDGVGQNSFKRRPIIEIEWAKNKISQFKGVHYLRFQDHAARVDEMTPQDLLAAREAAQKMVIEQPDLGVTVGQARMDHMTPQRGFALSGDSYASAR